MFWLSSMFHRNYFTDGPDTTPGLISCAGTMEIGEYDPFLIRLDTLDFLLLPFFAVFLGPVVLCVFQTSCYRLTAVITSLVDTRSRLG